ncbi:SLAM family member 6-like isoform X2 [Engystomops pustulosus]|uniref:SLAM family member 6-like isoform X2 n=1 Tax=Engystomops pustulosus TaxID=76066 RepID=UPI003AFB2EB6
MEGRRCENEEGRTVGPSSAMSHQGADQEDAGFHLSPGVVADITKQTLSTICGGSILFQVNIPKNIEIYSIFWSYTGTGKKATVAIAKEDGVKVINGRFQDRLDSHQPSFSLKLSNVNEQDNGMYEAQIFTNATAMYRSFTLQVCKNNYAPGVQWLWYNVLLVVSLGTFTIFFKTMTS